MLKKRPDWIRFCEIKRICSGLLSGYWKIHSIGTVKNRACSGSGLAPFILSLKEQQEEFERRMIHVITKPYAQVNYPPVNLEPG